MAQNKLKPCPFCGGTAGNCGTRINKDKYYYIICQDCNMHIAYYHSEEKAEEAWNRRTVMTHEKEV